MKIKTDRLIIRKFIKKDLNDYCEILQDEYDIPSAITDFNKKFLKSDYDFALVRKENPKVIGMVNLYNQPLFLYNPYSDMNSKEFSVIMNPCMRGKGYMTEAVKGIVKHTFEKTNLDALYARILISNIASLKLFDKCGFKFISKEQQIINSHEIGEVITKEKTKSEYKNSTIFQK